MKRPASRIVGVVNGSILKNFSEKQLTLLGAVAVAYNGNELVLHEIAGTCLQFRGDPYAVTSRINGTEGLVAIILEACSQYPAIDAQAMTAIKTSLQGEGFSQLKGYRDAAIHSTPYNIQAKIGRYAGRQGKRLDVLLTEEALDWLALNLAVLHREMIELHSVVTYAERLCRLVDSDAHATRLSEALRSASAQHRALQVDRLAVRKPPEFPDVPELLIQVRV